jgi:hypothetical protein
MLLPVRSARILPAAHLVNFSSQNSSRQQRTLVSEINYQMESTQTLLHDVSRRNSLSEEAVSVLLKALESSGYTMAQFDHPELGGMGQWSGGMTMIGDFSNSEVKGRVDRACRELAEGLKNSSSAEGEKNESGSASSDIFDSTVSGSAKVSGNRPESKHRNWWPEDFGAIASSGSQNGCDYAYSRGTNRLAIRQGSQVTIYHTGNHEIYGVAQQQGNSSSVEFQSQLGTITARELNKIE